MIISLLLNNFSNPVQLLIKKIVY